LLRLVVASATSFLVTGAVNAVALAAWANALPQVLDWLLVKRFNAHAAESTVVTAALASAQESSGLQLQRLAVA
jgi:hypothetical protein